MSTEAQPVVEAGRWNFFRRLVANVSGRALVIFFPSAWLGLFFLVPIAVVFGISLAVKEFGRPPYSDLLTTTDGTVQLTLHLSNYIRVFTDPIYINAFLSSVRIAGISTLIAILIGYPMAYAIARAPDRWRNVLLMLVILPFWTSFLLRVYALTGFLRGEGVINNTLGAIGFQHVINGVNWLLATIGATAALGWSMPSLPFTMMQTDFAVYVGIVYSYLPFFILPLFTTLVKLDTALLEASADLGARPFRTFLSVTLPLSMPGVVAGAMLVFIPAIGEFVIPSLLGGPGTQMIGRILWDEFFAKTNWPRAAALAMTILVIVVIPIMLLQRAQTAVVEARR